MKNLPNIRLPLTAALLVSVLGLSACAVGYRCPLSEDEKPDSPTACASMQDAMAGARAGTGGKTSVLMDDKGRLVPHELLEKKVARPLALGNAGPYHEKSGDPVFHQPQVYEVWTGAFVDADGNLHDGHTSWFTTPGRWAYGTVDQPSGMGDSLMKPARPDARPAGRVVKVNPQTGEEIKPATTAPATPQAREQAALQNLSNAASSAAQRVGNKTGQQAGAQAQPVATPRVTTSTAPSVTAPAINLAD
ncbi:hypothetical protein [Paraburkholderia sp. A3RO-2L]|jgi:hypothetical protein|uniref:hypothetical protein n=1 Tax=unclassified Paraburkholderia TaxID=2615204 RepID=UPI0032F2928C|nr:hypothetical protein [Burkholderia vietnamiensis]